MRQVDFLPALSAPQTLRVHYVLGMLSMSYYTCVHSLYDSANNGSMAGMFSFQPPATTTSTEERSHTTTSSHNTPYHHQHYHIEKRDQPSPFLSGPWILDHKYTPAYATYARCDVLCRAVQCSPFHCTALHDSALCSAKTEYSRLCNIAHH